MVKPKRHERPEPRSFEEWVRRAPGARVTRKELATILEAVVGVLAKREEPEEVQH